MSAPTTFSVQVSNIAATTTKATLHDFFTFCGKISEIDFHEAADSTKTAVVHFEKPTAAKTALMLNGGTLDGSNISVTSETEHTDAPSTEAHHDHPIDQTDKPRAGIAAEYLAKGYILSDGILQRAIEIDQKQGISTRFLSYFNQLDKGVGSRAIGPDKTLSGHVTDTLKSVDEQRGISKSATDYYSKAIGTPLGQTVQAFYTTTSKQVLDIHAEAMRIKEQQTTAAAASAETPKA